MPPDSENAPRRRQPSAVRRAGILNAALRAFSSAGFNDVSLGDVAAEVGVTRAVLYDHFPSKQALYAAVLAEQSALFLTEVGAAISADAAPSTRMRQTTAAVLAFADEQPEAWRLLFTSCRTGNKDVDTVWHDAHTALVDAVVDFLSDDLAESGVPEGPSRALVVDLLVGALTAGVERLHADPELTPRDVLETALRVLWFGLRNGTPDDRRH